MKNRRHTRGRSTARWIASLCAIALVAAVCGDDDDSSSNNNEAPTETAGEATSDSGGDGGSSADVRGVTDDEILVDIIMTLSGPQGAPFPGLDNGVKARLERANAEGGVHGRMIRIVDVLDDAANPNTATDQARRAVEQDDAFAVFATSNALAQQTTDYFEQQQVPFIGWSYLPNYCDNTWGFGFNGCVASQGSNDTSIPDSFARATGSDPSELSWAIQGGDDPAGQGSTEAVRSKAEARGATILYSEATMPTASETTDYSPYVSDILAGDPDVVYLSVNFPDVLGMSAALSAAGFEGIVGNGVAYIPGILDSSPDVAAALEGAYIYSSIVPQEEQTPAIIQMEKDLEAIGAAPLITTGVGVGYWSADVFLQMLEAVGPDLTPQAFHDTINGGWVYEVSEGGTGPVSFPENHQMSGGCAAVVRVIEGKFESVVPYDCYGRIGDE